MGGFFPGTGLFVRTASFLIPVEAKAKNGTAKSMRTLISSEKYADIHYGIKFTVGNIGDNDYLRFSLLPCCPAKTLLGQNQYLMSIRMIIM